MRIAMLLYKTFTKDSRVIKECKTLTKAGHSVKVICIGSKKGEYTMENIADYAIIKEIQSSKDRMGVMPLVSFWVLSFFYLLKNRMAFDALHCHDLTGLPGGTLFKILNRKIPLIYDSHELFPDAAKDKLGFFQAAIFFGIEFSCSFFVNYLISTSPLVISYLQKRYKFKETIILENYPEKSFSAKRPETNGEIINLNDDKKIIVYPGAIMLGRGYEQLIEATKILAENRNDFILLLIGDGHLKNMIKKKIDSFNLNKSIILTGWVPYKKLPYYLYSSHIGLILFEKELNNRINLSNKLFEYISCEVPIISSNLEASRAFLDSIGALIVDDINSPKIIAEKIEILLDSKELREEIIMKEKALKDFCTWERIEKRLVNLYNTIMQRSK